MTVVHLYPILRLDEHGRCPNCLRKPLPYKTTHHWFCPKCCRSYGMRDGVQIDNWAWHPHGGGFVPHYAPNPTGAGEYAFATPSKEALRRAARERH